ncbi:MULTISPECIES: hypothetical protein [Photorhabdus]|nr:hypothetical protein [Photorhabdus asymbiotica]
MTGVSECSQQRGNLKDNRYICMCLYAFLDTLHYFSHMSID